MTGFNMPPGVSPSDIPGNRPEDAAWDKILDDFCSSLDERQQAMIDDNLPPWEIIEVAIQFGINLGRKEELYE